MQPSGNTLTPTYNTSNPAEQKGMFPMRPEYTEEQSPQGTTELRTTITQADTQPRLSDAETSKLLADARAVALGALEIRPDAAQSQENVTVRPIREGGETPAEYNRQNIANSGVSTVRAREAALVQAAAQAERG